MFETSKDPKRKHSGWEGGEEKEGRAEEEAAAQLPEALEKSREPRRSQRAAPLGAGGLRASS